MTDPRPTSSLLKTSVLCLLLVFGLSSAARAQTQFRTTVRTNHLIAGQSMNVSGNVVMTSFTASTVTTWRKVTLQNRSTNISYFVLAAITSPTNGVMGTNILLNAGAIGLAAAGTTGDSRTYEYVIPTPLVITVQSSLSAASSVALEAFGN